MARDSKTKLNKLLQCNGDFFGAHSPEKQLTLTPRGFLCHRRHHSQTGPAGREQQRTAGDTKLPTGSFKR